MSQMTDIIKALEFSIDKLKDIDPVGTAISLRVPLATAKEVHNFFTDLSVKEHQDIIHCIKARIGLPLSNANLCDSLLAIDWNVKKLNDRLNELQLEIHELKKDENTLSRKR
jgi:hypothetical protein